MLLVAYGPTSGNYDFVAYSATGDVWNGAAYVSPPAGGTDPAAYRITATQGPSGRYTGAAPAGSYGWELRLRASTWAASTVVWAETGANVVAVNGEDVEPVDNPADSYSSEGNSYTTVDVPG